MRVPERYAVIGQPIAHSRSPQIHRLFAEQTGQQLTYEALEVAAPALSASVQAFFAAGGAGLNVTLPHKQAVLALCAHLTERARAAGAVNTLRCDERGALHGDNTDGVGLVRDLTHNLGLTLRAQRILLLGAGGAARGVLAPLLALAPSQLIIANRTRARAEQLARSVGDDARVHGCSFEQLSAPAFDLILNATAASLQGERLALPSSVLSAHSVCYDMAYGARHSAFTQWATQHGAQQVHLGLGMLVEQAAESFYWWRGVRPDSARVLSLLRAAPDA